MNLKNIYKKNREKRLTEALHSDINSIKHNALALKKDLVDVLRKFKITHLEIAEMLGVDDTLICRYLTFGKCQRNPLTNLELYGQIIDVLKKRIDRSHIRGLQAVKVLEHHFNTKLKPRDEKNNTEN